MSPSALLNDSESDRNAVKMLWKVFVVNARVMFKLISILSVIN